MRPESDVKLFSVLCVTPCRGKFAELLFQPKTYELPDVLFQPSLTSQMIMKRDIDIRKDVYAHVVLSSSTTIFQRIGTVDVALTTMSFKVVAPPKRMCSVL